MALLCSCVAAALWLSSRALALPAPEQEDASYSQPIGLPTGGFTTQFYGPTPNIITLSMENFSIEDIPEVLPFVPEDLGSVNETELAARAVLGGVDNRVLWTDKNYPFSAMGKIQWSNGVYCSGTLIGPRHVATAKHCAPLDGQGVSLRFMPAFYDGESFPGAYVTTIIHLPGYSVNDPNPDSCDIKEDWAVFILDQRLGESRGYLGARVVDSSIIGTPNLIHLGYPGDLANGQRPYRQEGITIQNRFDCGSTGGLVTNADCAGGQSGGAIWVPPDANGNRFQLGVLSAASVVESVFAGGNNWLNGVIYARENWP